MSRCEVRLDPQARVTNHQTFHNLAAARLSVFRYIETFYNSQRLHQTLNYLTPNQFEAENATASAA